MALSDLGMHVKKHFSPCVVRDPPPALWLVTPFDNVGSCIPSRGPEVRDHLKQWVETLRQLTLKPRDVTLRRYLRRHCVAQHSTGRGRPGGQAGSQHLRPKPVLVVPSQQIAVWPERRRLRQGDDLVLQRVVRSPIAEVLTQLSTYSQPMLGRHGQVAPIE